MPSHALHSIVSSRRLVLPALLLAAAPAFAFPIDVRVTNTPLPVTGTVNTTITNSSVPVSGSVNANITNGSLPVTGTVQLGGTPAVEEALPSHPFFDRLVLAPGVNKASGPASGTLAVTTLSFTNFGATTQTVFVFNPALGGPGCGAAVTGGSNPSLYVQLPPNQTTQLQFPTPLVMPASSGASCLAFSQTTNGNTVEVYVNGFSK